MRMSRMLGVFAALAGTMGFSSATALPTLGGEFSPFAFKAKPAGSKPNKVSQKKKRLNARRLNKHK
ncbi:hypothetical protein SDC64_07545 [Acinetobacter haemolyticus]|uniref:hypothetical protein n=1 Tax=Acinetobacter haemolyticus TaxID=29430 RepID=UPI002A6B73E5|nr:hypothetical protein [Acinetobacter haemolyticus]WPO68764.1 hypothetical protein SDC64_07545 [Acinetobacter haemolyticus]